MLTGVILRIGVIESAPFTAVRRAIDSAGDTSSQLSGYVLDLIEHLRKRMGFTPEILLAPTNQTYAEMIEAVAKGVYDIVVADLTVTAGRRDVVAFSTPIFDNAFRLIVRKKPVVVVDLFSYLKPYTFGLWVVVFAVTIYATVLVFLLERNRNVALHNDNMFSSLCMSMWYTLGNLMGYGADFTAVTAAGRLLTVGLYLMSLVLVATYTANLASDLTLSKTRDIISGIDDIRNGKIPFHRIGIRVGTAGEDYYLREISGGIRNFYSLKSRQDLYNSLLNSAIDVSFMDIGVAEYVTNNVYCNLTLVGSDFDKSTFAIATPKQWLYGQDLDVNILALRESGVLDELKRKWFQINSCQDSIEAPPGIEINALSGLFLTFGIISVLSLLLFAWEKRCVVKHTLCNCCHQEKMIFRKEPTTAARPTDFQDIVLAEMKE
jgi:ABC-type amino acid transport substrate-binding protein